MMKKKLLTIAIVCLGTILCRAATLTVSNNPNGGAQYATLQDAYDAASAGDILLIEGTDINYLMVTNFDKPLILIGIGFNPDKTLPKKTKITNTSGYSQFRIFSGAGGSQFYGIEFIGGVQTITETSDLVFEDCKFNNSFSAYNVPSNNLVFRNCVFDIDDGLNVDLPSTHAINVVFENCLFDGYVQGRGNALLNVTFNHCMFLRSSSVGIFQFNNSVSVSNCIFMNGTVVADVATTGGTFNNNIARLAAPLPPPGNSGSGNLSSTDPLLVNYTFGEFYSTSHDYDVQVGSPAIGAADDGTDIGIHGGTSSFSETGEVLVTPIVRSVIINNTTVSPGGTLNVQVEAGKPNID